MILMLVLQEESEKDAAPPEETDVPRPPIYAINQKLWGNLYVEVLYTIKHKLGANSSNYVAYTEDLYEYARETFNMSRSEHEHFMNVAGEEKPPIPVLNVTVIEAQGLEAKDPNGSTSQVIVFTVRIKKNSSCEELPGKKRPGANGTSDPYCMLGIQPDSEDKKHPLGMAHSGDMEDGCGNNVNTIAVVGGLRGLKRFGASFKRRERRVIPRENEVVPARLIRTTTVKTQTLSPKWREKFRLDIDDARSDRLHLDIWDHDDETSVIDAAKRLNEVSNLKGLGRYFKEIAQSARTSNGDNVDDFLGSVNLPVELVSSNGLDKWFSLVGRSHRSNIQGQVHLKLQLGTREDRGVPTGNDNEREVLEHQQLIWVFVTHELRMFEGRPYQWAGDLPQQALTILHQHAIQGDITEFQQSICQWISYFRKHQEVVLDYSLMYQHLEEVNEAWQRNEEALSIEAEETLANSFRDFVTHCLDLIREHRTQFPTHNTHSRHKLKFMVKCLKFLYEMDAFKELFPFRTEIRVEVSNALKKGTVDWMKIMRGEEPEKNDTMVNFIEFVEALNFDLQKGRSFYHLIFETIDVNFSAAVYRQMARWVSFTDTTVVSNPLVLFGEITNKVDDDTFQKAGSTPYILTEQNREHMNIFLSQLSPIEIFELFLALQEFSNYKSCLSEDEQATTPIAYCHLWFQDAIKEWFSLAQSKIRGRIYFAMEHDRELHNQPPGIAIDLEDEAPRVLQDNSPTFCPKYSSSSVETIQSLNQLKEFWFQLMWPDKYTSFPFIMCIVEATTAGVVLFSNLLWKRLKDDPHCFNSKGHFLVTKKVILYINNLEYALGGLTLLEEDLYVELVIEDIELKDNLETAIEMRKKIKAPIREAQDHFRAMIDCFVKSVASHMNYKIKKLMFHLAWGPEKLEPEQSIAPLLDYLERIFRQMRSCFLHITFQRLVQAAWQKVLAEYSSTSLKNTKEKPRFFRNLYISLSILTEFFLGNVAMLPLEELQCQIYKTVEREVRLHQSDTYPLIEYYFFSRAEEQFNSREAPLGYLTVNAFYDEKKGTVFVEVAFFFFSILYCIVIAGSFHAHSKTPIQTRTPPIFMKLVMNARGLLPCDPNGLSDPFVIMQLVPKHLFPDAQIQRTSIHMKTLNPIFMETFEWSISAEQCRNKGAGINFVVMDFDYMRKNDFEGEGYYPFYKMPAHEETDTRVTEPMELILTCPNIKSDILIALGKRTWDKDAVRLVAAEKKKS